MPKHKHLKSWSGHIAHTQRVTGQIFKAPAIGFINAAREPETQCREEEGTTKRKSQKKMKWKSIVFDLIGAELAHTSMYVERCGIRQVPDGQRFFIRDSRFSSGALALMKQKLEIETVREQRNAVTRQQAKSEKQTNTPCRVVGVCFIPIPSLQSNRQTACFNFIIFFLFLLSTFYFSFSFIPFAAYLQANLTRKLSPLAAENDEMK